MKLTAPPPHRALLAVLLALLPLTAFAGDEMDLWYVLELQGSRAGWQHTSRTVSDGHITTTDEVELHTRRGSITTSIGLKSVFVETEDGKPVSMVHEQRMAAATERSEYEFREDGVRIVTTGASGTQEREAPSPGGRWLTPAAADRFLRRRLEAGAEQITLATLEAERGLMPISTTYTVLERTTVEALGRTLPAIKCSVDSTIMPGVKVTEFLDERGVSIRSQIGPITAIAADKALAVSDLEPPEIMASTLVKPDRAIPNARRSGRAVFTLSLPGADALPDLPTAGVQRVERTGERSARVTIDLSDPMIAADADDPRYREASAMINGADERIVELTEKALASAPAEPRERAERLRRFVHSYIRAKNLEVGFASASEVARTREGDCSEHGTLLAAMLRADGIPARVVSGVLYVDRFERHRDVFGYHMWTQALLEIDGERRWIDLDPTLPTARAFDATHVALATSALSDGELTNDLVALVPLLGRLEIKVESVK
jgi:transglutaminase-like putative cysteine protease